MNTTDLFAIAYLGSVFGEAGSATEDGRIAFVHDAVKAHEDGSVPYAALYDVGSKMIINCDIPTALYYQLVGFCALNEIEWDEFF